MLDKVLFIGDEICTFSPKQVWRSKDHALIPCRLTTLEFAFHTLSIWSHILDHSEHSWLQDLQVKLISIESHYSIPHKLCKNFHFGAVCHTLTSENDNKIYLSIYLSGYWCDSLHHGIKIIILREPKFDPHQRVGSIPEIVIDLPCMSKWYLSIYFIQFWILWSII